MFVTIGVLTEDRVGSEPSPPNLEDESRLRLDWERSGADVSLDSDVDN